MQFQKIMRNIKNLDKLVMESDDDLRDKFISLDKETSKKLRENTFSKSTDDKLT